MEKEKLLQLLVEEGYPEFMWEMTTKKLESLDLSVNEALSDLLEGKVPSLTIEGYSYDTLVQKYRMKPVGAILTLDWLVKSPHEALMSLNNPIKL